MPVVESLRLGDMQTGEPIPPATYHVRIAKTEEKTPDPTADNPDPYSYLAVTYVVVPEEGQEEHAGRHVFENCTYNPKGSFALRQLAVACFGEDEDMDVLEKIRENAFVDAELLIAVSIEKEREDKKTGKTYPARNNVKKRMPLGA